MAKAKTLKKQWYPIVAPKIFRNVILGETLVYEPEKMVGKNITQNLMNLTNDVKRQNININFEIVNVEDGKAYTNLVGYSMVQSSIKRLVRKNINKIDMSFTCSTSDKEKIRIKPILITRSAVSNSIVARIRRETQEFITKNIGSISYDNFINDIISHKLQSALKAHLKKIYPLKVCEIRSMCIDKIKKVPDSAEKAKSEGKKAKTAKAEEVKEKKVEKTEQKAEEKKEEKLEKVTEVKAEKEPLQAS